MKNPALVVGDHFRLPFPTTIQALREMGPDFLTRAFHASGVLQADNYVSEITSSSEFVSGGMGRKLLLSVSYEISTADLHADLFVKLTLDFEDPRRDLFSPLMEPEVRFALLSRRSDFPIITPKCYFADFHKESGSGILISQRITYGQCGIEPCHDKGVDYLVDDLLGHYSALTAAMARLAAHHKNGKLRADIEAQFPFDSKNAGSAIPYTAGALEIKIEKLLSFVSNVPQLFPGVVGSRGFLDLFAADLRIVLEHEFAIRFYLNSNSDYIALCHWNMNLDNAWFWRDGDGMLQTGLLDWGSVGQMNVAQAFYGMSGVTEVPFLNLHRQDLIDLFVSEYRAHGGPAINSAELGFMIKLAVALMGTAWMLDSPAVIESHLPDVCSVADRFDPKFKDCYLARAQFQWLSVLLNEWHETGIGVALRQLVSRRCHD